MALTLISKRKYRKSVHHLNKRHHARILLFMICLSVFVALTALSQNSSLLLLLPQRDEPQEVANTKNHTRSNVHHLHPEETKFQPKGQRQQQQQEELPRSYIQEAMEECEAARKEIGDYPNVMRHLVMIRMEAWRFQNITNNT
jgi:hypothetical protein